jgi:hypothetical protein
MFLLLMVALLLVSVIRYLERILLSLCTEVARNGTVPENIHAYLFPLIGLFILLGIIIAISAIPCGIGLLFSLPLSIGAV